MRLPSALGYGVNDIVMVFEEASDTEAHVPN